MFAVPENTIAPAPARDRRSRHPVRTALEFALDRSRWRHLLRYDPDERFAVLLESTIDANTAHAAPAAHDSDDVEQEVWLLSWLPGQHTHRHDHGVTTGAFTVVMGTLTETVTRTVAGGVVTEEHPLSPGQSRVFGPGYVHEVRNDGPDPAVSVHVYRSGGRTIVRV